MRHHSNVRKFGRKKNARNAFMKGLVLSLISHGKIETTLARAKELRPMAEKLTTLALKDTLASKRLLSARLYNQTTLAMKLAKEIAPKYKGGKGGYTRIIKTGPRLGDGAEMALIEFI